MGEKKRKSKKGLGEAVLTNPQRPPAGASVPQGFAAQGESLSGALALHRQGRLGEAEAAYRAFLQSAPDHAEAHYNRGNVLQALGRLEEALTAYQRALALVGDNFGVLVNLGSVLQALGRYAEAAVHYRRALAIEPGYAEGHNNLANALREMGQIDEALVHYRKALEIKPDQAGLYSNLGNLLQDLKRFDEALAAHEKALELKPDLPEAHNNRGNALRSLRRPGDALAAFERALELRPDYAEAHYNLGNALRDLGRAGEALAGFDRALELRPDYAEAHNNRGNVRQELRRFREAMAAYDRALELKPDYPEAHNNRGNALQELRRFGEAMAAYDQALELKPDYAEASWNKALLLLLRGEYGEGWRLFESRWRTEDSRLLVRTFRQPLWLGDADLRGKRILVHPEQGFGDALQMLRYVPLLLEREAEVFLEVPGPLVGLASEIPGVSDILTKGRPLPDFDCHCPFMSLPLAFGTRIDTIPADVPYLKTPAASLRKWGDRLGARKRPRIGLTWSGSTWHRSDRSRSIPLDRFRPLLDRDADFYSLQKEYRDPDREWLAAEPRIRDFSGEILDFSDTAGLVEQLDWIITVDTAVAHLAGALGKEVWILIAYSPDYRWLLDREDSPWYPTARLFRQTAPDDWDSVIDRIAIEIESRMGPGKRHP